MMSKDRTDLYPGEILQHNIFSQIKTANELKGSSSYPVNMIGNKTNFETREGNEVHIGCVGNNI